MIVLDIIKKVTRELGKQADLIGMQRIGDAVISTYKDIYNTENFSFYLTQGILRLSKYDTYIIDKVLNNQITVTQTISRNEPNTKLYISKEQVSYDVSQVVNQTFYITQNTINGNALVGTNAYHYVYAYNMPSNCSFNKEITIIDPKMKRRLLKTTEPAFSQFAKNDYYRIGDPVYYMSVSPITPIQGNVNYITFYPTLISSERNLIVWYFRKPFSGYENISNTDYNIDIPEEFSDLLVYATLEYLYATLQDPRYGYMLQKKTDVMSEILKRNNGDEAMIRIFSEYPPYNEYEYGGPMEISVLIEAE